ncbi:MAG: hypothetical protein J6I56_07840 [Lachnospiraceae bacterium]|nr:hypothetical protein [Lachnospiraceae bacterium]
MRNEVAAAPEKSGVFALSAPALILLWLSVLTRSDALYIGYLFPGLIAAVCAVSLRGREPFAAAGDGKRSVYAASALYAIAVTVANGGMIRAILAPQDYFAVRKAYAFLVFLILVAGSIVVAYQNIRLMLHIMRTFAGKRMERAEGGCTEGGLAEGAARKHSAAVFAAVFFPIFIVDRVFQAGCAYPGILTTDSISQVSQVLSGQYMDQHPFWHTAFMGLFIRAGYALSGSVSAGISYFTIVQAGLMAACFAYAVMTLYEAGCPKRAVWGCALLYLILPYHVVYSATLWKDVLFGGAALMAVTALFRLTAGKGGKTGDRILLCASGAAMCLFRSNGWLVLFLTTLFFLAVSRKALKDRDSALRKTLAVMAGVLVVTLLMNGPVLRLFHVEKADMLEAVGVPLQQVAGFLKEEGPEALTGAERDMLEKLAPPELLRDVYEPELVDPVKAAIRIKGGLPELEAKKGEYLGLYLQLMREHPGSFARAYVTHTRGFWNAGYDNYIWAQGIGKNDFGVTQAPGNHFLTAVKNSYLWLFENSGTLKIIKCIGLWVFMLIFLFAAALKENRYRAILALPGIAVVATLLLATPAGGEFRYVYAVMTTLPFAAAGICLCPRPEEAGREDAEQIAEGAAAGTAGAAE